MKPKRAAKSTSKNSARADGEKYEYAAAYCRSDSFMWDPGACKVRRNKVTGRYDWQSWTIEVWGGDGNSKKSALELAMELVGDCVDSSANSDDPLTWKLLGAPITKREYDRIGVTEIDEDLLSGRDGAVREEHKVNHDEESEPNQAAGEDE